MLFRSSIPQGSPHFLVGAHHNTHGRRMSEAFTIGVEEEHFVTNPKTRSTLRLMPPRMMARCRTLLGERVTHEMLQSQIEVATPVCHNLAQARDGTWCRPASSRIRATSGGRWRSAMASKAASSTRASAGWFPSPKSSAISCR